MSAGARPEHLASCPCCGCLILVYDRLPMPGRPPGPPILWDPGIPRRRLIRASLTAEEVARQGFGLIEGGHHECPPPEDCALKPQDRPGRVLDFAINICGDGAYQRPWGRCSPSNPFDPRPGDRQ